MALLHRIRWRFCVGFGGAFASDLVALLDRIGWRFCIVVCKLIFNERRRLRSKFDSGATEAKANAGNHIEQQLMQVRNWASSLDRDRYQAQVTSDGLQITATPPEDVEQALQDSNEDLERGKAALSLLARYFFKPNQRYVEPVESDQLAADIVTARQLLENPPSQGVQSPWDVPTLVAAAALEAHLLRSADLSKEALFFAADTVIRVGQGEAGVSPYESVLTVFPDGAERSAARVIPLLLLPAAASLRAAARKADWPICFEPSSAKRSNGRVARGNFTPGRSQNRA